MNKPNAALCFAVLAMLCFRGANATDSAYYEAHFADKGCHELVEERRPANWKAITGQQETMPTEKPDSWGDVFASLGKSAMVGATAGDGMLNEYYAFIAWWAVWERSGCSGKL